MELKISGILLLLLSHSSTNICIIEVPEGERREGPEKILEAAMVKNFPKWGIKPLKSTKRKESQGETFQDTY